MPTPGSPTIVTSWQERCCGGALEGADQERLLELAADERRRVRAGDVASEAGAGRERAEERERLRLALHLHRLELLVVEDALGRAVRLLRDRDPVHGRRPLQARGGVDDVARHDSLALLGTGAQGDHRFARVDADPHLQRERRVFLVQLLDRLQNAKARADSSLGVVLVRDGRSEDGHHRVPDELLDRAPVALDLLPQAGVVGTDARADVLRVGGLRGGGEADEVAEEDGHDLALLVHAREPAARSAGAAQKPQNWRPSGCSLPQEGQVSTPESRPPTARKEGRSSHRQVGGNALGTSPARQDSQPAADN